MTFCYLTVACAVRGDSITTLERDHREWLKNDLFMGGIEAVNSESDMYESIITKSGYGASLVDKLDAAVPPPLLLRSLLNNPSVHAVVRSLFAVLLKHW